jgi:hypothetical protein
MRIMVQVFDSHSFCWLGQQCAILLLTYGVLIVVRMGENMSVGVVS